ncbi:MAG: hypothetical protein HQ562_00185 [Candidatus Marinimicrobia bacterium]|nr:hypothetical protein [Candidatus Neomarinimicrobiota bacterium]
MSSDYVVVGANADDGLAHRSGLALTIR